MLCNKCLKHYVGQTLNMLRLRWNNYKDYFRKFDSGDDCMQRHLYKHFQLPYHTVFWKIPMLFSLIRPILEYPLKVMITEFIPLRQKHIWDLNLKVVTVLISYVVIEQRFLSPDVGGLF